MLEALSGNMGGALFLVKVCKNFCCSLLEDLLIVCFYDCLLLMGLSLFSALFRFHRPVVSFSTFCDAVFSCQLFLVVCVLALVYCTFALLCASTFAFVGELSIFSLCCFKISLVESATLLLMLVSDSSSAAVFLSTASLKAFQ